jgi:hypothetical protein
MIRGYWQPFGSICNLQKLPVLSKRNSPEGCQQPLTQCEKNFRGLAIPYYPLTRLTRGFANNLLNILKELPHNMPKNNLFAITLKLKV